MLSLCLLGILSVASSPYPFEIKEGFVLELVPAGVTVVDEADPTSYSPGVRLSYLKPDESDSIVAVELEMITDLILSGSGPTPRKRYLIDSSVLFYEVYNPYAFRLALGFGGEKKGESIVPQFLFRVGIGRYFYENFGAFVDVTSRSIWRETKVSFPAQITGSLQFIF